MRIGSLCSGYGGLDLAALAVFDGDVSWFSDISAPAVMAYLHHWPNTRNLGDIRHVDWRSVDPVDVLVAGYPCQPFSLAGKRRGVDDERHLWPAVAEAIRVIGPRFVILENVSGHRSQGFGDVQSDLAALGFDAAWGSVRASDVGAPHTRDRLFVVAVAATAVADPTGVGRYARRVSNSGNSTPHGGGASEPERVRGERVDWGRWSDAIASWERGAARSAPPPVAPNGLANPAFHEWMMGLPSGFVTAVPGLSRAQVIQLLGNGVVPQQAETAIRELLGVLSAARGQAV
ncbi:DNA (cytosine-5)-methyltransferase 1 [Actinokineospora baliensis]|uniref:DNA cytosine methyltransferase n=1 Tax=Actinokineospora baliensis TaxID=547056 RepID=UPI0035573F3E|nr:DNA (cytosine-5)-methyltransferase 1 [Actinokineospora baliensis]